jgi:hypothetical protein
MDRVDVTVPLSCAYRSKRAPLYASPELLHGDEQVDLAESGYQGIAQTLEDGRQRCQDQHPSMPMVGIHFA